MDAALHPFRN